MTYSRHATDVPSSIALPADPDDQSPDYDVRVEFDYAPGCEPKGLSGPPENYDPGEGPEFVVIASGGIAGPDLPEHVDEAIANWLFENWTPPAEGPDDDRLRDERMDAAL